MMKIGLLTGRILTDFALQTLKPVLEDNSFKIELAIIDNRPRKSLLQKLNKNLRRGRGGYILIMALKSYISRQNKGISTHQYCYDQGIDVIETTEPYDKCIIENIKKYTLDILVLTGGYGIVKEPLLSITPIGILSYHHGDMRKYRGMPFGFWELYNNEKEMMVTVQILSAGLDCGIPVEEKSIEIKKSDTPTKLQKRALEESAYMLYTSLKKLSCKEFMPEKIQEFGKIYTLPDLKHWIIIRFKLWGRRIKSSFIYK